ncbi:MAG TPA: NrpR regulatory domain-containing protein [Methanospirillum sp.]|nr:NrpR regulatory domain-containing protein [Methanospirillum sp.]
MIKTEHKYIEILRILKDYQEPMGAKRLSELLAERGYVMTDRAVQYYLRYLDTRGFTEKVGNQGRILTNTGINETDRALVEDRIGFVISKLERLAFRSTFDPDTSTGDVAYNLTVVPDEDLHTVMGVFERVRDSGCSFFRSYGLLDRDPRIPSGHTGILTVCSITMDGVFQHNGIPVKMAYGGTIRLAEGKPVEFVDLIGYQGSTVDPLQLFINSGLTAIGQFIRDGNGVLLANIRQIPGSAGDRASDLISRMQGCGFRFPLMMGRGQIFNLATDPNRISLVSYSGMNSIGYAAEEGFKVKTEIGAGTIPFSRILDYQ